MVGSIRQRRYRGTASALAVVLLLILACGDDKGPNLDDREPPQVVSTIPSDGATDVPIGGTISATFSEAIDPASVSEEVCVLTDMSASSVSLSDDKRTITLVPSADLAYDHTYTATIASSVTDLAGNAMEDDYNWSFTTESAPIPNPSFPLMVGKRWLYDVHYHVDFAYIDGSSYRLFTGSFVLYVLDEVVWQGTPAFRVFQVELPNSGTEYNASYVYLADRPGGVEKWSNGMWKRLTSDRTIPFDTCTFFFAKDPEHRSLVIRSADRVTVPLGTFDVLKKSHSFEQSGEHAPAIIDEWNVDYYADGVGLVKSIWKYSIDDKDWMAPDIDREGEAELRYVDTGPFPALYYEEEYELSGLTIVAQEVEVPCVIIGEAHHDDNGLIVYMDGILPNIDGIRLVQDWYVFDISTTSQVDIYLKHDEPGPYVVSDINMYLFEMITVGEQNTVRLVDGTSGDDYQEAESLSITASPGTYFVAVQAMRTNVGAPAEYWLSLK